MKLDANTMSLDLQDIPAQVKAIEHMGFDAVWTAETQHDAFLPLVLAAEHTRNIQLGTAIAVAFARSPGNLAYIAWDLAKYSRGRFILGLGSQVKAHNIRRFGATWEKPAAKMREIVLAIRALWECWQNRTPLNFRGEFFNLNLMTPFFDPGPHEYSRIPIYIAGVNPLMCQVAGEVCDGLHVHPLTSPDYLREVILPNVMKGLEKSGRTREDMTICLSFFAIPTDDPDRSAIEQMVRQQIGFYASTPAYKGVMELHGWQDAQAQLSKLVREGRWKEIPEAITDEMLHAFAVVGPWTELPTLIKTRYGSLVDRGRFYFPFIPGEKDPIWRQIVQAFKDNTR
jgi:probable F420-dependent oxidoreductase